MFRLIKFLLKLAFLFIVLIIISQLEYNGRKIETYIKEFIYSYKLDELANDIKDKITEKAVDKIKDGLNSDKLKDAMEKIKDEERKDVQDLLEE